MIFVLIPILNRKELTLACLASFAKQTYKEHTVVIIDDGSTDGSGDAIRQAYPSTVIIQGDGTWWWTKSMNEGLRSVLPKTKQGDFVLFMNNDTELGPDYLEKLIDASIGHGRALVGSLVRNFYDARIQDAGVHADWNRFAFVKANFDEKKRFNENVDALAGRGMLIPVEVFQKTGLLSEKTLPHYAADYDFSMRAKRQGFTILMSYEAIVLSKDKKGDKQRTFWKTHFNRRSSSNIPMKLMFALSDAPTSYLKCKGVAITLGRFMRDFSVYALKKFKIL